MNKLFKYMLVGSLALNSATYSIAANTNNKTTRVDQLPVLKQEAQHKDVTKRIVSRLTRSHYREFNLNEEFSEKIFDRYLDLLDYGKYLFVASDITGFEDKRSKLAAELKNGQIDTAYDLFNLALKKRFQRFQYALSLLEQPIAFDTKDEIDLDYDKTSWAKDEKELDTRWFKKVKYDALNLALTGKTQAEIKKTLTKRYETALKRLTQTSSEDAYQAFMNAFTREIDPHTSYLAPRSKKQFNSEMSLSLEGIGAVLKVEDEYATIASMVTGGPAAKSKQLAIGDRIVGVGQAGKEIEDVVGWRLDDTVELIRGPKGTKVLLEILPAGQKSKTHKITIVRDKIRLEDREVKSEVKTLNGKKVGVLTVPSFYMGLTDNTKVLLEKLQKQKVSSIVIDLRSNGGGSLSEAISLSGLFIESGPVVQIKNTFKNIQQYDDTDDVIFYKGPLVVLVDRYSASASEIFAAAMQDYGRAVIVGEPTFGKGTVQTHQPLSHVYDKLMHNDWAELGALQYTIQKFYRINGGSTQLKGVTPDILMPTAALQNEFGESFEDNALPWDSIRSAQYLKVGDISGVVTKLDKNHQTRISGNREYKYIQEDIDDIKKKKATRYIVSLNFAEREKENKEYDDIKLKRENERLISHGKKPIKKLSELPKDNKAPDPYLDEAVAIAVDLTQVYPQIKGKGPNDD